MADFAGQCLCGGVSYAVKGPTGSIVHCHCSRCRRWHGSAFRSRVVVRTQDFAWTSGQELVSYYDASEFVRKSFCKTCGSNLLTLYPGYPDVYGIALGGISGDLGTPEAFHVFVGSKADWYDINDELEQFEELPADTRDILRVID